MTPGGIIPLWGRDHLGIGGRHHSVTRGDIIQELGGGFLRNQHAGQQVRKVATDKLRDEVKRRGFLDLKETGGMTSAARTLYHRAKTDLIVSGKFVENDDLFWRVK